jgi:photosystem II stability/assembly factor-like uncharacterized protein
LTIHKEPTIHCLAVPYFGRLLLLVSLAVVGFTCPLQPVAFAARFERLGPYGGTVRSLLISAKTPRVVYLGTGDGQIFKSMDDGLSWSLLHPGLGRRQLVIDTIVEDPASADHLYVGGWDLRSDGGGLFESGDAGRSWRQVRLPSPNVAVRGFAISKGSPSHMIAGTGAGIFVSADGGKTWLQRGARMDAFRQAESVGIDPHDPGLLFVGTWHLGYRSSDFGKTWVGSDHGMIPDSDVFSVSIDERSPNVMFASACTGLYRSVDHGGLWTRLKVLPKSYLVRAQVVLVDPTNSNRIFGGTTEGLFISQDSGKTWSRVTSSDLVVNAVQVDPSDGGVIMIGTELHGVLRSTDGGRAWAESNAGFVSRSIARILPDPGTPGRFLVGEFFDGQVGGFYAYDGPSDQWVQMSGQDIPGEGMLSLVVLPDDRGRIAGTTRGAFLQRPDSPGWSSLAGLISSFAVYDLAIDKGKEWVFAGTNDGVYRSPLDELSFQKPSGYSVIPRVFSLLASRTGPDRILAGTHLGVFRSDDSGATWSSVSEGIPDHTIIECLVFSPESESHLFAGTNGGLYESKNGGDSWQRAQDGRLGVDISSVIFLDSNGASIMAADNTFGGVFLSEDAGAHWDKIESPEFGSPVRTLAQDPLHHSIVYLGTSSEGVYRLWLPTQR